MPIDVDQFYEEVMKMEGFDKAVPANVFGNLVYMKRL